MTPITRPGPAAIAARVILPFAAGYFLSYLYRTVNAVIGPELAADPSMGPDSLGAGALGLLTSAYFAAFAVAQLPIGIALDRYGPRKVQAVLLLVAAGGSLFFSQAEGLTLLILGRALIGLGVAACMVAAFKAFRQWFDPARLPLLQGLVLASGGLGAMTSTVPVEVALTLTDWRGVFVALTGVTLVIWTAVVFVAPEHEPHEHPESLRHLVRGMVGLFANRFFWVIASVAMIQQPVYLSLQGLWAGPWLQDVAGYTRSQSADVLFLMAATMVGGHLLTGTIAERLGRRGFPPRRLFTAGTVLFLGVFALLAAGVTTGAWLLWPLLTLVGTTGILSYAILSQHFPPHLAGRVNTALNLLVFLFAFLTQWGMGAVIDLFPMRPQSGYPIEAYQTAFGSAAVLLALSMVWQAAASRRLRLNAQNQQSSGQSGDGINPKG